MCGGPVRQLNIKRSVAPFRGLPEEDIRFPVSLTDLMLELELLTFHVIIG